VFFCVVGIPTGFVSDRVGYKPSLLLGAGALVVANLLPIASPDYGGFLRHFLLIALARSLVMGAGSAYIYEFLKERGRLAIYKKVEGDARFYSLVGRVVCWAVVGYMMERSVALPYWASAFNALVALAIVAGMPPVSSLSGGSDAATAHPPLPATAALKRIARSPYLLLLMLQGLGIFVLVRVLQVNLYQPMLADKAFDVTSFGWIMSLMTVFEAVGAKLAHRVKSVLSDLNTVTVSTVVLSACLVVIALSGRPGTLAALCLFSLAAGVAFPVQRQVMNDAVTESRFRATVLSVEQILDRSLCALAVLPLGSLVKAGRVGDTLYVTGIATVVLAIVIQLGIRRGRAALAARAAAPSTPLSPA
jgi:MFS family permease